MLLIKGKKLFLIGMEDNVEEALQQKWGVPLQDMLILKIIGPEITQPYGDLMRDIIIKVYNENVKSIFVVGVKEGEQAVLSSKDILTKLSKQKDVEKKVATLNYIFKNCMVGFPYDTVTGWLRGSGSVIQGIERSIEILRHHPLIPDYMKIQGVIWDEKNKAFQEIDHLM